MRILLPINFIMQENVKLFNNKLKINKLPKYGENCRLKGEDIKKGQKILEKGVRKFKDDVIKGKFPKKMNTY